MQDVPATPVFQSAALETRHLVALERQINPPDLGAPVIYKPAEGICGVARGSTVAWVRRD